MTRLHRSGSAVVIVVAVAAGCANDPRSGSGTIADGAVALVADEQVRRKQWHASRCDIYLDNSNVSCARLEDIGCTLLYDERRSVAWIELRFRITSKGYETQRFKPRGRGVHAWSITDSPRGGPTREVDRIEAGFELRCGDRGRLVKATKQLSPNTAASFDTLLAGWGYTRVEGIVRCR